MSDRFRDPRGWLLDSLPWRLRCLYFAWEWGDRPSRIPDEVRLIGCRRPPERVFTFFRRLHGIPEQEQKP